MQKKALLYAITIVFAFISIMAGILFTINHQSRVVKAGTLEGGISTLDIMEEKRIYEREGFKLDVLRLQKTPQLLSALLKGELDVAVVPAEMAAKIIEDNGGIVIVDVDMMQNQAIVMRRGTSPEDLVGGTVGALLASGTYKVFKAYMKILYNISVVETGSIGKEAIRAVNLYPGSFLPALQKGDVDAIVVWEPFVSKAAYETNHTSIISFSEMWKKAGYKEPPVMLVWVANKNFARMHPDLLKKFVEARRLSAEYWMNQPEETKRILMTLYGLDEREVNLLYERVQVASGSLSNYIEGIRDAWRLAWLGGYLERNPDTIGGDAFWVMGD